MSSSVDIYNCEVKKISSRKIIHQYILDLCYLIDMERHGDPHIEYFDNADPGFTFTQIITTSLISGHFKDLTNGACIDIFSCKFYDPNLVAEFTRNYFGGGETKLDVSFRGRK
ncbi:MAG: S-adenosylmethionine decarboxylase [Candidatus Gracilibacteria bacterium]|nr:S-adenosylmethionine decarboxylase [Candidatus Gracilibacteria bacterium]